MRTIFVSCLLMASLAAAPAIAWGPAAEPVRDIAPSLLGLVPSHVKGDLCQDEPTGAISYPYPLDEALTVHVHAVCRAASDAMVPASNDCSSPAYKRTGWKWDRPVDFVVDQVTPSALGFVSTASVRSATVVAMDVWDVETGADLAGRVTTGVVAAQTGVTGDGINQISFMTHPLAPTAVAVTVTFSNSGGFARESDAYYNPIWAWSTDGSGSGFDYQNVAAHEIGHTFGLDHPQSNGANSCLTMYAFVSGGELAKRTLGTGDINGIRAIYGA